MGKACPDHDEPVFECEHCSSTVRIRQAVQGGRIERASDVIVEVLEPYVDQIRKAIDQVCESEEIGMAETAWISDESCICDFPIEKQELVKLRELLGVPVEESDYIYEIAKRLRDKKPA
jgi:hypothetical protein